MSENYERTAELLLAHFNQQLVAPIVQRILKQKSGVAWKKLTDALLMELQTQVRFYGGEQLKTYAERVVNNLLDSNDFRTRATAQAEQFLIAATSRYVDDAVRINVQTLINGWIKNNYNAQKLGQEGITRYKTLFEEEVRRLAVEAAQKVAKE